MANYMYIKQSVAKSSMSGAELFCKICLQVQVCELCGVTNYASKYDISVSLLDHKRIHLHGASKTILKL